MGKDRVVLVSGLVALGLLAWVYLVYDAWRMQACGECMGLALPQGRPWSAADFSALFGMWSIMMIGMMVPAAAPVVMLVNSLNVQRRARQRPVVPAALFLAGYLVVWIVFSGAATLLQWQLHDQALLSPMMLSTSPILGSVVLLATGAFQLSPLKNMCLARCRSPLAFLMTEWREGSLGALSMGLRHGGFCVACCWLLMTVLFVGGVMNILWVALLTLFVLAERLTSHPLAITRFSGVLLIGWAVWIAVAGR